jgi:hypothetical protein
MEVQAPDVTDLTSGVIAAGACDACKPTTAGVAFRSENTGDRRVESRFVSGTVCGGDLFRATKNPAFAGFFSDLGAQERTRTSTVLPAST